MRCGLTRVYLYDWTESQVSPVLWEKMMASPRETKGVQYVKWLSYGHRISWNRTEPRSKSMPTWIRYMYLEFDSSNCNKFLCVSYQKLVTLKSWSLLNLEYCFGDQLCERLPSPNGESTVDCNSLSSMPNVAFTISGKTFELSPEEVSLNISYKPTIFLVPSWPQYSAWLLKDVF